MACMKSGSICSDGLGFQHIDVVQNRSPFFLGQRIQLKCPSGERRFNYLNIDQRPSHTKGLRTHSVMLEKETLSTQKTLLHDLYYDQKQSPWYDNLRRPVSDLKPLIEKGIRGVTSNPTIFQKAISSSNAYDDQFRQLIKEGKTVEEAYWGLVVKDIQDACKLFHSTYEESRAEDGYVSVEVSPKLAHETDETIEAAKWLHKVVNQPNVHIKIPATAECVPAIKQVISLGINVNVTLIFSLPRYEAVIDAYLEGLETSKNSDLSKIASVASFFVSRVDTLIDKRLEALGTEEALALRGKVSTMPDAAVEAFLDHGKVARTIDMDYAEAQRVYKKIEELGISWADVGSSLEMEGVESFLKSFDDLLGSLEKKAAAL